jgi:hypothetical protein
MFRPAMWPFSVMSSNLFAEHTSPDIQFGAVCEMFRSLVWIFIAPSKQMTSVHFTECENYRFIS